MSFITKRERVFHDLELCDLPPRNEGKIKAYASCTDARAWSHFGSSKTEHLTELIKRNNDLSSPVKYVPTKVIVDTLLASKNLEIGRLKRKIEEFEQMLAAYDDLDLDCAQKCEIAKAHEAIKAANKDLDDLCLNLNMSTCTDGFDTESFETGKSRSVQYSANWSVKSKGGESDRSRGDAFTVMFDKDLVTQGNQTGLVCPCDASVSVEDPRIDEMKEQIISKDAKLNAMRNSLAIMENDICEPFGIYAHIYTALEKIFGVLCQNSKFRQYINLMTAGKDIRCIDIKGKILFKMKILEKFCLALIAPCSKGFSCANSNDCPCFFANVNTKIEPSYQSTPDEYTSSDSVKRSQLVADIMEHEEMKEILSKESTPDVNDDSDANDESDTDKIVVDAAFTINEENQKRIKDLQECYDGLLNCYEDLKHETDCIRVRCAKYEDLELELERLRAQLKEYNSLWNEREHYRKRSEDLDSLKQQYMVLAEESSGLETKLRAESEINHIKANAIDELRSQNISLEKRLNEIQISFEKDKNNLQCQLQESECKCMCQEQQIKSLKSQINTVLAQQTENIPREDTSLSKENELLKEQLKRYQDIEYEFQDKISSISELEAEIAKWRAAYEELFQRHKNYEEYIESYNNEKERLLKENSELRDVIKDKSDAVENLMDIIKKKSLEIHKLSNENQHINNQLEVLGEKYEVQVNLSRRESQDLLQKVKDYDDFVQKQEALSNDIEQKMCEYESLKLLLKSKLEENEKLKRDLNNLQNENAENKINLERSKSKTSIMERKVLELEDINQQLTSLKNAFEQLSIEKNGLENELRKKASQLESAIYSIKLNKKESGELLRHSEVIQGELTKLHLENSSLQQQLDLLREENKELRIESSRLTDLELELSNLKKAINELLKEKAELEHSFLIKEQEISNMHNSLENKIEENQLLLKEIDALKSHHLKATGKLKSLENETELHQTELDRCRRESSALINKLQFHEKLESELQELKTDHEAIKLEKDKLQRELEANLLRLQKINREKSELQSRTDDLLAHNNDLEEALVSTRNEMMKSSSSEKTPLAELTQEIQKLKTEKVAGQQKIRDLLHKLDESEQLIANFDDEIHARDHKIATMQNHVNALEDEIRNLHHLLEQAVDTGNDMKNTSLTIENARKQIEAHHSKASHNMKLELAVLQQSKSKLEDQLSTTRSQYDISTKHKQNYLSEIFDLKNDREIIVTDIKQLEIYSVGDSELISDDCEIERILHSIDRIRKAFDARHAKTVSLEQTLAKVQDSSLLVLNKADEAKANFENEKQRILNEKEDALRDKNNLAKQLIDLKNNLNAKISQDAMLINDLEAEISNQKLIIDKINETTQKYIMTLEDEIQSLKDLYQEARSNILELEDKLSNSTAENREKEIIIKDLVTNLQIKTKEVSELQSHFDKLSKNWTENWRDMSSQPDSNEHHLFIDSPGSNVSINQVEQQDVRKTGKSERRDPIKPMYDLLVQQKPPILNEVQILSAEAQPTFDFVRSSYLNYKMKRLGPGILEHHSIASLTASTKSYVDISHEVSNHVSRSADSNISQDIGTHSSNVGLVDIYHSLSDGIQTSSKMITITHQKPKSLETYEKTSGDVNLKLKTNVNVSGVVQPTEHYNDSQTTAQSQHGKEFEKLVKINDESQKEPEKQNVKFENTIPSQINEKKTDKPKRALNINLPRVPVESSSFAPTTDNDNDSLDSYALSIYSHPIKNPTSDTTVMIPSSSEYETKTGSASLPTTSDSGEIRIKSRSFIELPSFNKYSNHSDSNKSAINTNDDPDHFIIYEDHKIKVKKPDQIFALVKNLKNPDYIPDEAKVRSDSFDENKLSTDRESKNNLELDTFNKFDDSVELNLANKNSQMGNQFLEVDEDHLAIDKTIIMPQQKPPRLNENEKSYHKGSHVTGRKSKTKTSKASDDSTGSSRSKKGDRKKSHHDTLAGSEAEMLHKISKSNTNLYYIDDNDEKSVQERHSDYALAYLLDPSKPDTEQKSKYDLMPSKERYANDGIGPWIRLSKSDSTNKADKDRPKFVDQNVMANLDTNYKYYEEVITGLRKSLGDAEKDHKMQMEAIKVQYDRNIRNIINEHNQGVMSIQSIHEETLRDFMRVHENEVENLRTMSIEAMRKVEKLEKECMSLKSKMSIDAASLLLDEVPTKCEDFHEVKNLMTKPHSDGKVLTKTALEAFDVKPRSRAHGPCTCSLDINLSDTIRDIFEQVDVDQRKLAELSYLKYIATKIANGHVEALDTQELSFLHLKVCRIWKQKLSKEEALQKKIDSLEVELIKKQRYTQQHMADIDRKVAQEKRRLEEVREAMYRSSPLNVSENPLPVREAPENNCGCTCNSEPQALSERRSAGDLMTAATGVSLPRTRRKGEHKSVATRTAADERRERRLYTDEPPTRLRRQHDRPQRLAKK